MENKRYKVICLGYKNPGREKIKELLEFESNYLEREKAGRRILIHPNVCLEETEIYNQTVLDTLRENHYREFNLSAYELDTKYEFDKRLEFAITI